ncbi:MAG: glycosyltransferase [Chloroflexia bacterium]
MQEGPDVRLSIVIPTLNEAGYLPQLLDALAAQTRPADEVIVADADSTDGTAELARERGARVVRGGRPAAGRNAGARAASGDLLLFLDADVLPPPDFLERAVGEFLRKRYDVATAWMVTWDGNPLEQAVYGATSLYFYLMQPFLPYAPGFCILVRRELHERIGGFDETLRLSEDMDYVRRAARHGRFGVLTGTRIPASVRRIRREGLLRLGMKYLWCEGNLLRGRPVREIPFEYEFGAFPPPKRERRPAVRFPIRPSLSPGLRQPIEVLRHFFGHSLPLWASLPLQEASLRRLFRSIPRRLALHLELERLGRKLSPKNFLSQRESPSALSQAKGQGKARTSDGTGNSALPRSG